MDTEPIKQEANLFQAAVQKLSGAVGSAGTLWSDAKFAELSSAVSVIANRSRDIMMIGDDCCDSIEKFIKISSEKY